MVSACGAAGCDAMRSPAICKIGPDVVGWVDVKHTVGYAGKEPCQVGIRFSQRVDQISPSSRAVHADCFDLHTRSSEVVSIGLRSDSSWSGLSIVLAYPDFRRYGKPRRRSRRRMRDGNYDLRHIKDVAAVLFFRFIFRKFSCFLPQIEIEVLLGVGVYLRNCTDPTSSLTRHRKPKTVWSRIYRLTGYKAPPLHWRTLQGRHHAGSMQQSTWELV